MAKLEISVEYCASCNYLPRAMWMAGEVLQEIQAEVATLALIDRSATFPAKQQETMPRPPSRPVRA